jgi:multiple sugar transport system ATP-binding protein
MGRAIVREPKAFLMDEPLSDLDSKPCVSMRAQLASLTAGSAPRRST